MKVDGAQASVAQVCIAQIWKDMCIIFTPLIPRVDSFRKFLEMTQIGHAVTSFLEKEIDVMRQLFSLTKTKKDALVQNSVLKEEDEEEKKEFEMMMLTCRCDLTTSIYEAPEVSGSMNFTCTKSCNPILPKICRKGVGNTGRAILASIDTGFPTA